MIAARPKAVRFHRVPAHLARGCAFTASTLLVAACGGGGGDAATTPAVAAPTIVTQPVAASALTDATASFSASASGTAVGYQWLRNGVAIAGATSSGYTTPPITWLDANAVYSVVASNAGGSVTSNAAGVVLLRSADQSLADAFVMAGSYQIVWNLNSSGGQSPGTNYATYDSSTTPLSPLTNGPQTASQTPRVGLAATLPVLLGGPTRILKSGAILVVPSHDQALRSSYVGSKVRVDSLAADNVTVAFSQLRSNYTLVSLSGDVKTGPPAGAPDLAHYLNSFYTNASVLRAGVSWPTGSSYLKFDSVFLGDRYGVFDCTSTVTTDANPTPCATGVTLASALAAGIASPSDLVTYSAADGTFSTVGGVAMWVATAPRPLSATLTAAKQYRIYFQLNGNIYTGALTRDGEPFGGSFYISSPSMGVDGLTFLPFNIRLNRAAVMGLAAAMAL